MPIGIVVPPNYYNPYQGLTCMVRNRIQFVPTWLCSEGQVSQCSWPVEGEWGVGFLAITVLARVGHGALRERGGYPVPFRGHTACDKADPYC